MAFILDSHFKDNLLKSENSRETILKRLVLERLLRNASGH